MFRDLHSAYTLISTRGSTTSSPSRSPWGSLSSVGVLIERAVHQAGQEARAPVLTLVIVTLGLATFDQTGLAGLPFSATRPKLFLGAPFSAHTVTIFGAFRELPGT